MVVVKASKLNLPNPSLSSSPQISSLLFEPNSLSLALTHSDSSISLYPSLFPDLSLPQTLVPAPTSSSTFLLLQHTSNPNPRVLFVVAGPHRSGAQVLLRFYVLQKGLCFARARVVCSQKGVSFDRHLGVLVDCGHGVSIRVSGSVNFFSMYSVSASKIWVFAVRMVGGGGDEDGVVLKLMRCAVVECCAPVWSVGMSFGLLMLGEVNGVRVFNLRSLAKGRAWKVKNLGFDEELEGRALQFPNAVGDDHVSGSPGACVKGGVSSSMDQDFGAGGSTKVTCNGFMEGRVEKHNVSVKWSSVKLRQDSVVRDSSFVAFKRNEAEDLRSTTALLMSVKAISIHALSPKKFLILDSFGDIHLMHVSSSLTSSNLTCNMRQLPHIMKVQKLAVLPDTSSRMQTVWIADGGHSLHAMVISDAETPVDETDRNGIKEKLVDVSVVQAIFASERIQDVAPLTANAILVLGQGSLLSYAIS